MPGAARLCGEACLRAGAGLVTVATAPENLVAIVAGRPELICLPLVRPADLVSALARADVVAIGPGLGRSAWAQELVRLTLDCDQPLVVDADALNIVAESGKRRRDNWILTPHDCWAWIPPKCRGTASRRSPRWWMAMEAPSP